MDSTVLWRKQNVRVKMKKNVIETNKNVIEIKKNSIEINETCQVKVVDKRDQTRHSKRI